MENTQSYLTTLSALTLRELIGKANKAGITKNDIVYISKENGAFILLYYTSSEN